jgi:signal transduction histidine kinase
MSRKMFSGPLARRFVLLAVLIALPFWGMSTLLLTMAVSELQARLQPELKSLSGVAALMVDDWYNRQLNDLRLLGHLARAGTMGSAQSQVLERFAASHPEWWQVALFDLRGGIRLRRSWPPGSPTPDPRLMPPVARAIKDGVGSASNLYHGHGDSMLRLAIAVPLFDRGRMVGVAAAIYQVHRLQVHRLGSLLEGLRLPTGVTITLLDGDDRVIYQNLPSTRWIGLPMPNQAIVRRSASLNRPVVVKAVDGVVREYWTQRIPTTGWQVNAGIPLSGIYAVRNRMVTTAILLDVVVTLLTLGLAIAMARRFTQPAIDLRDVTNAFGAGQLDVRLRRLPANELGEVGRSFNRMADQIQTSRRNLEAEVQRRTEDLKGANSELQLANQKLTVTVDELQRLEQMRAEFLNMISHDLRIPLTSVLGYAELLEDDEAHHLTPPEREYLQGIVAGAQRMTALLEQLLDFARVEAGQLKLDCEAVDLAELVSRELETFKVLAGRKQQHLDTKLVGNGMVLADPDRIQQVLANLLSNAIKYTPTGSHITVSVEPQGDDVRVAVADDGPGLTPGEKGHVFQRFYRGNGAGQQPGTGLGLSIAKGIIETHGGAIGVDSEPGHGATFWFALPTLQEGGDPTSRQPGCAVRNEGVKSTLRVSTLPPTMSTAGSDNTGYVDPERK